MSDINSKLLRIQTEIKAPKNLYNKFGKYNYRNAESIFEAVKPFLKEEKCILTLSDDIEVHGDRVYVKATVSLFDTESKSFIMSTAYARESECKKGMDESQITGAASSYARKYALNGMFLLDDTKDADTDEYRKENGEKAKGEKPDNPSKISEAKVKAMKSKCKSDNVPESRIFTLYKVKSLSELTEVQHKNAVDNWDKIRSMS